MAVATASTFTVENHEGVLYNTSPTDTKLFSLLGGLFGGEPVNSIILPWQEYSLRDPAERARTEGDDHPTSTVVNRSAVHNVLQITHESIDTSWTKRATSSMLHAIGTQHPEVASVGLGNPVGDEHMWQNSQQLKEIVRDCEHCLWNGALVDPSVVGTARKTQGIVAATVTNHIDKGSGSDATQSGSSSSDDVITATAHGLSDGDKIQFTALTGGAGLTTNETYYVVNAATNTFQVATSAGGTPVNFTTDIASGTFEEVHDLVAADIIDLLQLAYDNGGIADGDTATLWANSYNKRRISNQLIVQGGYEEKDRNIAGVECTSFITDFGNVNIFVDRFMPKNTIQVISMEELRLCFLQLDTGEKVRVKDLQDAGGSRDRTIVYFEYGLRYGNELKHAKMTGLSSR